MWYCPEVAEELVLNGTSKKDTPKHGLVPFEIPVHTGDGLS